MGPFSYDIIFFLSDIDECALGLDNCHAQGTCTNNVGSFFCACSIGFSGDGVTCVGKNYKLFHCSNFNFIYRFELFFSSVLVQQ